MARQKTTPPTPSKQTGQRSQQLPLYMTRILPIWQHPGWQQAEFWRAVVQHQPVCTLSRNTLIQMIFALDHKIEPRESSMRNELKSEIQYYEKFIMNTGDYDYVEYLEPILKDTLDIPFGGAAEVGREGDKENGRVVWIEPIDGATLFPTLNRDWPVGQQLKEAPAQTIFFPKRSINRIYMSPRSEIRRKGWGVAPPEAIYLAVELLSRGDKYYANLLLDTPEVGILDLMDMSTESAQEWVRSWKELLEGTDPFKIPVLYEHEKEAKFVSFTRSPTELMFDKALAKYHALTTAGYGLTLSDIGIPSLGSGGDTLAGSIRGERKTRRTGLAIMKKKVKAFFDRMLPESLEFKWIDLDDEFSVALGRARLASATAFGQMVEQGVLDADEARQQMIADGLISISIPEKAPGPPPPQTSPVDERPGALGKPIAPSQGGHGEILASLTKLADVEDYRLRRLIRPVVNPVTSNLRSFTLEEMSEYDLDQFNDWYNKMLWGDVTEEIPEITQASLKSAKDSLSKVMRGDTWWKLEDDLNPLLKMFSEIRKEKHRFILEKKYELGEVDQISDEDTETSLADKRFEAAIKASYDVLNDKMQEYVQKAVLAGVTKHLSYMNLHANELDTEGILHDNMMVNSVRQSIKEMSERVMKEFAEEIVKITNSILEE